MVRAIKYYKLCFCTIRFNIVLCLQVYVLHYFYSVGLRQRPGIHPESEKLLKEYQTLLESPLNASNYSDRFRFLLQCEEHQLNIDIRNHDMEVCLNYGLELK